MQPKRYRIVLWSLFVVQLLCAAGFVYTARAWGKVGETADRKPTLNCPYGIGVTFAPVLGPDYDRTARCVKEWYDKNTPDWIYTVLPVVWGGMIASPVLVLIWLFIGVRTMGYSWKKCLGWVGLCLGIVIVTLYASLVAVLTVFPIDGRFFYPLNNENRPVPVSDEAFACWGAPHPAPADLSGGGEGELLVAVKSGGRYQAGLYQYDFSTGVYTLLFNKIYYDTFEWDSTRFSPNGRQLWYVDHDWEDAAESIFVFDRREKRSWKLLDIRYGNIDAGDVQPQRLWTEPVNWSNDGECLFLGDMPGRKAVAYRVSDDAMQRQPDAFSAMRFVDGGEVSISHDGGYRALLCNLKAKDDTVKVCVLSTADAQDIEVSGLDPAFKKVAWLRWSPVENVLAIAYEEAETKRSQVRLVSVSGAQAGTYRDISMPEGDEGELIWSPDGKRLLLGGRWIYSVETEQMEEIADATIPVGEAAWSPDGSKVVFSNTGDGSLNVFDLATHRSQKLPPMPGQAGLVLEMFWAR